MDEEERANERRRLREERRKKEEEEAKREEEERLKRADERKQRKEKRLKDKAEKDEQEKKEKEESLRKNEEDRRLRREERERKRIEDERLAREEEEKRRDERERRRKEEEEDKKRRLKELEEKRKKLQEEDSSGSDVDSHVDTILSMKKKRIYSKQKIDDIISSISPDNDQVSVNGEVIINLLLTDELKEEVMDLIAGGFRKLIDYFSQVSSITTIIEVVVDIGLGQEVFNAKIQLMDDSAPIELKNKLSRIQGCYEILKGSIPLIPKIITDAGSYSILDKLFQVLSSPPPISITNMHIFIDLIQSYLSRKPDVLLYICENKDNILPNITQHLHSYEVIELLLKMVEVEMTQFGGDNKESSSSSSSSSAPSTSFFNVFSSASTSSSNLSSLKGGEKPNWTNEFVPYLILRINEILNPYQVQDNVDVEIDNIHKLVSDIMKKYPKSKVSYHLHGNSFSSNILVNAFKVSLSQPFTSPVSSSILSLVATLIDVNNPTTMNSSSNNLSSSLNTNSNPVPNTNENLPAIVNLLFKPIIILEDEREVSPLKAIQMILTIDDYSKPFNIVQLKCLHLIAAMVKLNIPRLDREIWESGILQKCTDLFFEFESNNLIHCVVESFLTLLIQRSLGQDDEEFMCHLLKDCSFVTRVVNILSGNNHNKKLISNFNHHGSIGDSIIVTNNTSSNNLLQELFFSPPQSLISSQPPLQSIQEEQLSKTITSTTTTATTTTTTTTISPSLLSTTPQKSSKPKSIRRKVSFAEDFDSESSNSNTTTTIIISSSTSSEIESLDSNSGISFGIGNNKEDSLSDLKLALDTSNIVIPDDFSINNSESNGASHAEDNNNNNNTITNNDEIKNNDINIKTTSTSSTTTSTTESTTTTTTLITTTGGTILGGGTTESPSKESKKHRHRSSKSKEKKDEPTTEELANLTPEQEKELRDKRKKEKKERRKKREKRRKEKEAKALLEQNGGVLPTTTSSSSSDKDSTTTDESDKDKDKKEKKEKRKHKHKHRSSSKKSSSSSSSSSSDKDTKDTKENNNNNNNNNNNDQISMSSSSSSISTISSNNSEDTDSISDSVSDYSTTDTIGSPPIIGESKSSLSDLSDLLAGSDIGLDLNGKLSLNDFVFNENETDSVLSSLSTFKEPNLSDSNNELYETTTTNNTINTDDIDIQSLQQDVVVVHYPNEENNKNTTNINSSNSIDTCNNNNNENININNNNNITLPTEKKRNYHNIGHIISLCIEVTHIVNKSKNNLLRDIVDECCSTPGQWDDIVVPKLKQEISYRNTKPIGTVSMRKGRRGGGPINPFMNMESYPVVNGIPVPPTETTSKFFF